MNRITITALEDIRYHERIPIKNKGAIQLLLPEYSTILQKREWGDRKVRKKGARREKGGFVSHVATTCLLSTSPPALFPNS